MYTPIDNLMSGNTDAEGFEESDVMKSTNGTIHKCEGSKETFTSLGYNRNNGQIFLGGTIITKQSGNDKDASCQAIVKWDKKKADCSHSDHCKFTEVYKVRDEEIAVGNNEFSLQSSTMEHVTDTGQIPSSLKNRDFPRASDKVYNRASNINLCGGSPTDITLYCRP